MAFMLSVGLTGGIGCGKSAAADEFNRLGVPIIDADLITRKLTRPGTATLDRIAQAFGAGVISNTGELDRRALRGLIFSDSILRKKLEAILHPAVKIEIASRIQSIRADYCITVAPLMLESGMHEMFDRILVVDCSQEQQIARVKLRDQCQDEEVHAIIRSQASREQRLAIATEILSNTGNLQSLHESIKLIHEDYLTLSATYGSTTH